MGYWEMALTALFAAMAFALTAIDVIIKLKFDRELLRLKQLEYKSVADSAASIAVELSTELNKHYDWAVHGLELAALHPSGHSVFSDRQRHYSEEKRLIAERFAPLLAARCRALVKARKTVILLVDSGSTMVPICEVFAEEAVRYQGLPRGKFSVYTNNLAGVGAFMEFGRFVRKDPYSDLVIDVNMLPGQPLATFAAILGKKTDETLISEMQAQKGLDNNSKSVVVISLVTGNWINIGKGKDRYYPIPLARDKDHVKFKQLLLHYSDEIYAIAPLGKVFRKATLTEINDVLQLRSTAKERAKQCYDPLSIDEEKARRIKLVTTSRSNDPRAIVLGPLSAGLGAMLQPTRDISEQKFCSSTIETMPHLEFHFSRLPGDMQLQVEMEFPHKHTRTAKIMKEFFFVIPEIADNIN